jgi:hypothetical protein
MQLTAALHGGAVAACRAGTLERAVEHPSERGGGRGLAEQRTTAQIGDAVAFARIGIVGGPIELASVCPRVGMGTPTRDTPSGAGMNGAGYNSASARPGPPVPPAIRVAPTTMVAPVGGSAPRLAAH